MSRIPVLQNSSGDENTVEDHALYSSTIHKVIFTINGVLIGLLQITPTNAQVGKDMLRGFLVLALIYFVLLVCEVRLRRNQALIYHFIGHLSHIFGSLAANMLISLIFPIFALIVVILCLFWFFYVMYQFFAKYNVQKDLESENVNPLE